jgi:hypothetical protein
MVFSNVTAKYQLSQDLLDGTEDYGEHAKRKKSRAVGFEQ